MRYHPDSSWISSLEYLPRPSTHAERDDWRGYGLLLVETRAGRSYGYKVPSWTAGLLRASRSAGRAFNRLVRGRYPVVELKERTSA